MVIDLRHCTRCQWILREAGTWRMRRAGRVSYDNNEPHVHTTDDRSRKDESHDREDKAEEGETEYCDLELDLVSGYCIGWNVHLWRGVKERDLIEWVKLRFRGPVVECLDSMRVLIM